MPGPIEFSGMRQVSLLCCSLAAEELRRLMSWVLFSLRGWFVLQSAFCSQSYVERCCNIVSRLLFRYWCTRA